MRIGIDLGGTKIAGVALDDAGAIRLERRVPTPFDDYDATLAAIADVVAQIERETGATGSVGVGTPGAESPATGLIKNANSLCLNGRSLRDDLAHLLDRPVRLANDADCFALSEAVDGAAAGAGVVFGVIIGTGCGGGIVIDGRVLHGPNAIAGEWGHNPLPRPSADEQPGPLCYCGRHGCIETWISGTGLARDYATRAGPSRDAVEIVRRAEHGDAQAEAALHRYADRLARSLASVINILDPDVIVLGGGVSNIERLYRQVPLLWQGHVFSDRIDTRLRPPVHGDAGGARGAAWLW